MVGRGTDCALTHIMQRRRSVNASMVGSGIVQSRWPVLAIWRNWADCGLEDLLKLWATGTWVQFDTENRTHGTNGTTGRNCKERTVSAEVAIC
jgi:hypothetical protein